MASSKFNVVLGVCGSVASYRAADLARDLMRAGADVRVCLTDSAQQFVTAQLFEALTGNPVLSGVFEEPVPGRMAHIDWARWAHLILVAPATANTLAKMAQGIADDMLTTIFSASDAPVIVAPAMNPQMYVSASNRESLESLKKLGVEVVEPSEGDVACGEHGQGKLAANSTIVEHALVVGRLRQLYMGKRVVITSGPTQEPIDSVRFLSNRSSGKMGSALARAASLMGAHVTVISGPSSVSYPLSVKVRRVRTADQMLAAALEEAKGADLIVGAAAVADFKPATVSDTKIRKEDQAESLRLVLNPDIIATLATQFPKAMVVGFSAEPTDGLDEVAKKLKRKGLFAIAANDVSNPEIGFESDENELALLTQGETIVKSGRRSKLGCAIWLLEQLAQP